MNGNIQDVQTTVLVTTIERAWGETDFTALQNNQVSFDSTGDFAGPLTIAVASQNSTSNGKVVVFGDSAFASDVYFDQYGNGDLFINAVDWAAGQVNMISLTSGQPISRQMRLPTSYTVLLLAIVFVILVPGLVMVGGVTAWLDDAQEVDHMIKRSTWVLLTILILLVAAYFIINANPSKPAVSTPTAAGEAFLVTQSNGVLQSLRIYDGNEP